MINRETALSCLANLRALDDAFETDNASLIDYTIEWVQSVSREDAGEDIRLAFVAAAKINHLVALKESGKSAVTSFKAGDISVKEESGNAVKAAECILNSALQDAQALIKINSFAFMGV